MKGSLMYKIDKVLPIFVSPETSSWCITVSYQNSKKFSDKPMAVREITSPGIKVRIENRTFSYLENPCEEP